jgi:hypothetical protein
MGDGCQALCRTLCATSAVVGAYITAAGSEVDKMLAILLTGHAGLRGRKAALHKATSRVLVRAKVLFRRHISDMWMWMNRSLVLSDAGPRTTLLWHFMLCIMIARLVPGGVNGAWYKAET